MLGLLGGFAHPTCLKFIPARLLNGLHKIRTLAQPCLPSVACAMRTERGGRKGRRAHSARYNGVYQCHAFWFRANVVSKPYAICHRASRATQPYAIWQFALKPTQ